MDAVSIIGGVSDTKADPRGLLILREYNKSAVGGGGPRMTRVVFSINLTSIDGLARNFQINPDDLIMATEAPLNDLLTISTIVGNFLGLANQVQRLSP